MKFKYSYLYLFVLLSTLLIGYACSTEKDALINKGYHNMTARYNGYYNAQLIIQEVINNYKESVQEDYNKILPLDLYPDEISASNYFPQLDDAIQRCEKVILRHSMPNPRVVSNKSVENCRWIDDNWLVTGKAHYIKRDFEKAKERLKYVSETSIYKGEESIFEAKLWLAKTHIQLGEYPEAKRLLVSLKNSIEKAESAKTSKEKKKKKTTLEKKRAKQDKKAGRTEAKQALYPKALKDDYEIVAADLYIHLGEYKKAIEHLEAAITLTKDKKLKARYMFILAQLYAAQGNGTQASYYYGKVARSSARYEMQFKAKIQKALTATSGSEILVKELNKMLKDGKNIEYKDQIYFALAELNMKKNDVVAAKINYTSSATWSIKNNRQKGESYLKLADINFSEKEYLKAQKYYDSSVQVLPEDYDGYEQLKSKAEGLADLVFNYELVTFEDSVQRIAGMSEKEREKFLEKTIENIKKDEERKKLEAEQKLLAQQARINKQSGASGNSGSKWYFYNPKLVGTGFNDFRSEWGQRVLEDNWRRSNKTSLADFDNQNNEFVDSIGNSDSLAMAILMAKIPLTQDDIDSSNFRILNSLYNLGIIYKEQLKEEKEAIAYFNAVLDRRIDHPKVLPALYQLYLISYKKGNGSEAPYKTRILQEFAESEIAQIILDPDYLQKKEEKNKAELNAYSSALTDYRQRRYGPVITTCNEIIFNYKNNQFLNKYYLLKAYAISKINAGNIESITQPLAELYSIAPDSEEGITAKRYLDQLRKGELIVEPDPVVNLTDLPKGNYTEDKRSKHYFILVSTKEKGDVNEIKIKISNFNSTFFKNDELTITDSPLTQENLLITVRTFDNFNKSNIYFKSFKSFKAEEVLEKTAKEHTILLISTANFSELFKSKDLEGYLLFYEENY